MPWKPTGTPENPTDPVYTSLVNTDSLIVGSDGPATSFADIGSGATTLIESQTPSGASSADFTTGLDSDHNTYLLVASALVPATDNTGALLRVSNDGGSTFESGASAYRYAYQQNADGGSVNNRGSTGNDSIQFTDLTAGSSAGESMTLRVRISNPADSNLFTTFQWDTTYVDNGATIQTVTGGGGYMAAESVDAVRLLMDSGNIESGEIDLLGVA